MTIWTFLFLFGGFVLLVFGADTLVRGASRMAAALHISPLVIGLTIVAFGSSAPELAINVQSAWQGQPDLAIGNVVGSNIANILLILGIAAIITPLVVAQQLLRLDVPLMIGASFLLLGLAWDGSISRLDGVLLFSGIVAYTAFAVIKSRRESKAVQAEYEAELGEVPAKPTLGYNLTQFGLIIVGLAMLIFGSDLLVQAATDIARALNIGELIIGLTIVAIGTSLPELAASVVASLKKETDIAVGNVVGSNLFNILSVLGASALVAPEGIAVPMAALSFDIPIMIGAAVACLPIFFTDARIDRWEGWLFLGFYIAYIAYLALNATQHGLLDTYSSVMLWFVLPLTTVTLLVLVWRAYHKKAEEPLS
jgi:cation:H+ antiporter